MRSVQAIETELMDLYNKVCEAGYGSQKSREIAKRWIHLFEDEFAMACYKADMLVPGENYWDSIPAGHIHHQLVRMIAEEALGKTPSTPGNR